MAHTREDTHLLAKDVEAVKKALEALKEKLSRLETRTSSSQAQGKDHVGFVLAANELSNNNPEIFPPSFDKRRLKDKAALLTSMALLEKEMDAVRDEIKRATKAVADEGINDALRVYKYIRLAAEDFPLLTSATDRLAEIFWKQQKPSAAIQTQMRIAK